MANRLTGATSPYLLQHAGNPVDWWQWGPEAFAEAQRRGVPILLSVGYAACHWCHVMAHESFEDPATAAQMNEHYVCIKVDREERPDVDAVYMEATQAMTGQGGWPMTCFLTPTGAPFYCGTYFPPRPRQGVPSFGQLLAGIANEWAGRRAEIESGASDIVRRLGQFNAIPAGEAVAAHDLTEAVTQLRTSYDEVFGGFGGAPKFPPSMVLEFLLRHARRTGAGPALEMARHTCEAMARGGMYDQLGGGFARYSVDNEWVVPHFEKMLYDNALLLRVYAHLWRLTGSELARRVCLETGEWLLREMRTDDGGFASALDADSLDEGGHSREGAFYVWTWDELRELLGQDDANWFTELTGVTVSGTFEHGASTLQLLEDPDDWSRYDAIRQRLLAVRARRTRPARDDKVIASWNGLAIAALAETGVLLDRTDFVDAARAAAELLRRLHIRDGRLVRASRLGVASAAAGVLDDYGNVADGFLTLAQVTGDWQWLHEAGRLLGAGLAHFGDGAGGFYDTADDAETLVRRPRDVTDNATPSGAAAFVGALVTYAALTGSSTHRDAAEAAMLTASTVVTKAPRFAGWWAAVAEALVDGPYEVAIVGHSADLVRAAWTHSRPGQVIASASASALAPDAAVGATDPVALLTARGLVDGQPAAYVCKGFVCQRPVTTVADLQVQLRG
ncbi:MAG: uncharacterized protein QOF57_1366 [Frankiaceae bacterium]|nr:uncharacterized protein [Frankiaceae bacterium]